MRIRDLIHLEKNLDSIQDDRPDVLKERPYATDPACRYYRFLYELSRRIHPTQSLELGTNVGLGASHIAFGNPNGMVVTVDQLDGPGMLFPGNVKFIKGHTHHVVRSFPTSEQFDILLIDTEHNFRNAYAEYWLYRPLVKQGGIILFDDISLDMETGEMAILWDLVSDPKIRLDGLHATGFGACIKSDKQIPSIAEILPKAESMMENFKKHY